MNHARAYSIAQHDQLPIREVPRIKTRVLVDGSRSESLTTWEQWIGPGGHIPVHYHEMEEVLMLLAGQIELTVADETRVVTAPANILVPAGVVHGLKPTGDVEVHLLAMFPSADPKIFSPDGTLRPLPWEDRQR